MSTLVIGYQGFVGSNLFRQMPESIGAGRSTLALFAGKTFDDVYCAAPQAMKWWANQNPNEDKKEVMNLFEACRKIKIRNQFVLISTVDVFDPPNGQTELDQPGSKVHPYGANRLYLEESVREHFKSKVKVIRLPALVGQGLKKNILYDIMNDNNIDQIKAHSSYQWFNLSHLSRVVQLLKQHNQCSIINVATHPIITAELVQRWFPQVLNRLDWRKDAPSYDIRSIYGSESQGYLYSKYETVELHLKPFIEQYLNAKKFEN